AALQGRGGAHGPALGVVRRLRRRAPEGRFRRRRSQGRGEPRVTRSILGYRVQNTMKNTWGGVVLLSLMLAGTAEAQPAGGVATPPGAVDGLALQYLEAGHGPVVVLLHGYAESSRMWRPLLPRLAEHYRVIAPDLPGIGGSAVPKDGLDMASAGRRM